MASKWTGKRFNTLMKPPLNDPLGGLENATWGSLRGPLRGMDPSLIALASDEMFNCNNRELAMQGPERFFLEKVWSNPLSDDQAVIT